MELKMPPDKRNSRISQDNYPLRNGRTLFSTVRTGWILTSGSWDDSGRWLDQAEWDDGV